MRTRRLPLSIALSLVVAVAVAGTTSAASAVDLGTAAQFAVLAGSTVTNTGPSMITGDLGVSPGTAVTGFPPGLVDGTIHAGDAVAAQAQSDLTVAYNNVAGQTCNTNLSGQDLGGLTLTPGVYCFNSAAQLTGTLTLNAEANPDALFLFQIGSALTTASSSSMSLIGGAQACHVFWQVGSSATLGTSTSFVGNILALTSITLTTGATLDGRALASNGATTLDTNVISRATCGGRWNPIGDIGGPCADPAYYGIFDNTGSTVAIVFRFRWYNGSGLHTVKKTVPAGAIFRTWEHWAKPGTTLRVAYKDPNTGNWVNLATKQAVKGTYPPCTYKHGFEYPTPG